MDSPVRPSKDFYAKHEVLDLVIEAFGHGYVVGQKPYGEQSPGDADDSWKEYQEIGRALGAHVTSHEVTRRPPFTCTLCGQHITDGRDCGCGARPVRTWHQQ